MSDEIVDNASAHGCASCSYGIVAAPEITGACEFYLERLAQALNGDITFCDCRAGTNYHANLLKRHRKFVEEARRDPRMVEQAKRGTHPDIEQAQVLMLERFGKMHHDKVPTIRFVEEPPRKPVPA